MQRYRRLLVLITWIILFDASSTAHASYTFTQIDVPFQGTLATVPRGLNDRGQIVGVYGDGFGQTHGFLYQKGLYTTIDVPGSLRTLVNGINNRGQIVGFFEDGAGLMASSTIKEHSHRSMFPFLVVLLRCLRASTIALKL